MSHHDDSQFEPADDHEPAWPLTSADRARFWAGLNRFLEADEDDVDVSASEPALSRVQPPRSDDDDA